MTVNVGFKPTVLGAVTTAPVEVVEAGSTSLVRASSAVPFSGGTIVISEEQLKPAGQMLASLNILTMHGQEIVLLGSEAEAGLNTTLDGFLAKLDKNTAASVFALFDRLQKEVKDADLEGIIEEAQKAKPSLGNRLIGRLNGKSPATLLQETLEKVRVRLSGKTKDLSEELARLQAELQDEVTRLIAELQNVEQLKQAYRVHWQNFALIAAVAEAFVAKATQQVAERKQALSGNTSLEARSEIEELDIKLQFLQSRALALEGVYTRLPADQQVIRDIQVAGVSTLGETLTTASSRFASIKMTLLSVNSALRVKSLQNLSSSAASLDQTLIRARGQIVRDASVTAAVAPGENRLAQVAQIEGIIRETEEIHQAVSLARAETQKKFAEAKGRFQKARAVLAELSASQPEVAQL
jgi:hypothetical protein